jgi:hypothetical protein
MRRHLLFEGFAAERVRAVDPGYRWDAAPPRPPCDPRNPRRLLFVGRLAYNKGCCGPWRGPAPLRSS